MFNLDHLQKELTTKTLQAQNLVERAEKAEGGPRPMDAEELKLFDTLHGEIPALKAQIKTIQDHEARRQKSQDLLNELNNPKGPTFVQDAPKSGEAAGSQTGATATIPAHIRRYAELKAYKPRAGESHAAAEMRAYRAGMWIQAKVFKNERAEHWCQNNGVGVGIYNAMGTTSNPDGGFLVPDEFSQAVIDLREQFGVFRRYARVWPMSSDTLLVPRRASGVTISILGENPAAAFSQSTPAFSQVQLVAKKFGGLSLLSSEIGEDSAINVADWLAYEFAWAFAKFEDDAGFTADGTSTWGGIRGLGNLFTTTGGAGGGQLVGAVSATTSHDTFAEIDNTDLTTLMGKLPAYALPNARWFCSAVAASVVFNRLAAVAGGNNTMTLREGVGLNYLGYPIVVSQSLPTTVGTLLNLPMLYFGDLSKAVQFGDRRGVSMFVSRDRFMDTDQIGVRGTERMDIVVSEVGDTTTGLAGPIVGLVGA